MLKRGAPPSPRSERGLVRAIGVWGLAASIVNVTVGGGIFRLPASPEIAGRLGAAAPLAYLLCAAAMGLIVVCIAQAAQRVSLTGGPYAYVEVAFGRYVGFLVGVLLWLIGCTAVPAVAGVLADTIASIVPAVGTLPGRALFMAVVFGAVVAINVRGVRQGTRLNAALTVAKLAPLLLLVAGGLFAVRAENPRPTHTPTAADLARASVFLIFAFAGVEVALVPSGEVRDPARTVPRAVFLAMAAITVLYVSLQVVAQGVLGPALVGDPTPLAHAAGAVFGPVGSALLDVGFVVSAAGYLSGMLLAVPRALYAFARDGILPRPLARVHERYHTPWVAIVVQSALAWGLAVTSGFEKLAMIANVSAALIYLGCAAAAWRLARNPGPEETVSRMAGGRIAPVLATAAIVFLLSSVTLEEWLILAGVLAAATVLYAATRTVNGNSEA